MTSNNLHNLMAQLVQENKSLWRIRDVYKKDAEESAGSLAFWSKLETEKLAHIEELTSLIKAELS